jgi:hypothetical protein
MTGRPDVDDGGSCSGRREGYGAALAAAVHFDEGGYSNTLGPNWWRTF